MAKTFTEIFKDHLQKEKLIEADNLDQLPSPQQLKGKIILKGTVKTLSDQVREKH